jgi:hypothetical protein
MQRGANTQKSLVAIALGILLLLALAFFWKDKENGGAMKVFSSW